MLISYPSLVSVCVISMYTECYQEARDFIS